MLNRVVVRAADLGIAELLQLLLTVADFGIAELLWPLLAATFGRACFRCLYWVALQYCPKEGNAVEV